MDKLMKIRMERLEKTVVEILEDRTANAKAIWGKCSEEVNLEERLLKNKEAYEELKELNTKIVDKPDSCIYRQMLTIWNDTKWVIMDRNKFWKDAEEIMTAVNYRMDRLIKEGDKAKNSNKGDSK